MQRQLGGSRAESRREQCARVCTLLHICRELLLTGMCVCTAPSYATCWCWSQSKPVFETAQYVHTIHTICRRPGHPPRALVQTQDADPLSLAEGC